jgi:hypothetical protein
MDIDSNPGRPVHVGWDVPEILHRLASPLSYCGLTVIGLTSLSSMTLYSDLSAGLKFAGTLAGMAGVLYCFHTVMSLPHSLKDLVADVSYHRAAMLAKFMNGRAITDFVDDRVDMRLAALQTQDALKAQLEELKSKTHSRTAEPALTGAERRSGSADRRNSGERRVGMADRRDETGERS